MSTKIQPTSHSADVVHCNVLDLSRIRASICEYVQDNVGPVGAVADLAQVRKRLLGRAGGALSLAQLVGHANQELAFANNNTTRRNEILERKLGNYYRKINIVSHK